MGHVILLTVCQVEYSTTATFCKMIIMHGQSGDLLTVRVTKIQMVEEQNIQTEIL